MTGFTPGPWKVQLAKGSYQRPAFVEAAGGKVVAGCFGNQLEPGATSIREAEDNARLIAAAPDMVAALEAICAEADNMAMTMRRRTLFNAGKAAVAKATGQTEIA